MVWKYEELLVEGHKWHFAYVMDGKRIVCHRDQPVTDVRSHGEDVERTRRDFKLIIEQHAEVERLQDVVEDLKTELLGRVDKNVKLVEQHARIEQLREVMDENKELKKALESIVAVQVDPAGKHGMTLFDALAQCDEIATAALAEE